MKKFASFNLENGCQYSITAKKVKVGLVRGEVFVV